MSFQVPTRILQARLAALGFSPGPIDGQNGRRTAAARRDAFRAFNAHRDWELFHKSGVHRVAWHWTAGAKGVIEMEKKAYNGLLKMDATRIDGTFAFETNGMPAQHSSRRASHKWRWNTGAIGLSCDAMAGAQERPLSWGSNPLTWEGIDAMLNWTAELCEKYWIPATKWSTYSHAEVQPTFGVKQRFKWDFMCLPGDKAVRDPIEVGDILRDRLLKMMAA